VLEAGAALAARRNGVSNVKPTKNLSEAAAGAVSAAGAALVRGPPAC